MPDERRSLYHRVGGYDVVAAFTDDLFQRMAADPELTRFSQGFSTDSLRRLRQLTVDYLCAAAGGPVFYTGRDLRAAHQGLGIGPNDWKRSLDLTRAALEKQGVAEAEKREVLELMGKLEGEVVDAG